MRTPLYTLALLAALAAPTYADDKPDITEKYTVLNLTETAERRVEQDRLMANLMVDEKGLSAAEVQNKVNKKMEAALKLSKKYPAVKVSTGSYNVWEEANNGVWRGRQTINLNSDNSKQTLEIVGLLQKENLQTQGVRYYLSDEAQRALNDLLTTEALNKIKSRAEKMAATLGMKLVRFAEINPGYSYQPFYARPMMARAMTAEADSLPAVDADEQNVTVSISAKVYLQ